MIRFGALRWAGLRGTWGFGLRRLFDNFIGRKRDVDGGVLAGLSCRKAWELGRDKLTVTFQTTISLRSGRVERRETVDALIGCEGSVWNSSKGIARSRATEGFPAKEIFGWMTGQ